MTRPSLRPPMPRDVEFEDGPQLTRNVAQGIFSSLEVRRSEIYFEEAVVRIQVEYDERRRPPGRVGVFPETVTIAHAADPFMVSYDKESSGAPRVKPRQVRWVVHGLKETDRVVIRPKEGSPPELFNFLGGSTFVIPAPANSIASGLPFIPHFDELSRSQAAIVWKYDVEVWREDRRLFWVDPIVVVEGDY